jgi:hypothetical protein
MLGGQSYQLEVSPISRTPSLTGVGSQVLEGIRVAETPHPDLGLAAQWPL